MCLKYSFCILKVRINVHAHKTAISNPAFSPLSLRKYPDHPQSTSIVGGQDNAGKEMARVE